MPENTPVDQITPDMGLDAQVDPELEALDWTGGGAGEGDEPDTDVGLTTEEMAGILPSVMKPDPDQDQPRNKGGRPKGSKTKRKVGRPVTSSPGRYVRGSDEAKAKQSHRDYAEDKPFPFPKTRHFKDENAREEIRVPAFFDFWKRTYDSGYSRRIMVYVYRIWPIMREGSRQVGKLSEPITQEDLLRMYGVGDYNIKMNDAGNAYATVCQCTVKNVGDRNMTENPPVLDPEGLDHMDPLNQSYLKFLASRGELRKGDDDMAGVEVVRELTGMVRDLTDKTLSERDDDRRRRPYDPEAQAAIKGMEIVQQAAVRGQEMLDQSLKRSQEINQQQGDPIAVLERATKLVREIAPMGGGGGDSGDKIVEIMSLMMNRDKEYYDRLFIMQAQQITELKDSLVKTQTQAQTQETRPKTMLEQISEFSAVRDKMRDMLGIDDEPQNKGGGWTDHIPAILQGLTMLGAVIVNAAYNISVARTGQGTPIAPPNPDAIMTPEQAQAVQTGHAAAQPPQFGPPHGQQGQTQQGQPQTQYPNQFAQEQAEAAYRQLQNNGGLQTMTQFHAFLQMIEIPLLKSFQEGESGSDFAAKLIELGDNGLFGRETTGQQIYDMVTQYGLMMVSTVIKTYNPIWRVVSMTPGKWDTFLSQFFNAAAIWEREDQDDEAAALKAREEAARAAASQVRRPARHGGPQPVQAQPQAQAQPQTVPAWPQEGPGGAGAAGGSVTTVQEPGAPGSPASAPGHRPRTPDQG